mmetsp:Transcript_22096/g.51941  ORF Transcript_22096/g.51941 Transcript_22096/m.51941 type:complete len:308 (+) Transcript_22096:340-1263(+)
MGRIDAFANALGAPVPTLLLPNEFFPEPPDRPVDELRCCCFFVASPPPPPAPPALAARDDPGLSDDGDDLGIVADVFGNDSLIRRDDDDDFEENGLLQFFVVVVVVELPVGAGPRGGAADAGGRGGGGGGGGGGRGLDGSSCAADDAGGSSFTRGGGGGGGGFRSGTSCPGDAVSRTLTFFDPLPLKLSRNLRLFFFLWGGDSGECGCGPDSALGIPFGVAPSSSFRFVPAVPSLAPPVDPVPSMSIVSDPCLWWEVVVWVLTVCCCLRLFLMIVNNALYLSVAPKEGSDAPNKPMVSVLIHGQKGK